MSRTIDQRVVEMQFDNRQFERNVATSMSTIAKLKQSLNFTGATKGLEGINASVKNFNMNGMSNAIEAVGVKFSGLQVMAVTALTRITNAAINAGSKIVSALTIDPIKMGFQEYETQIGAIQTILANTQHEGTNLQQVNNALDILNQYADKTIYNFTEMTRNIGTFTAAGVSLDTSVSAIKGIANLAAVSGSTSQQASTAMYQLSQALASGTVKLMDWNSVVNAGMGGKVFQDALSRTAAVMAGAAGDVEGWRKANIEAYGSFRDSLTEGAWLTTDVLTETLAQFTGDLTDAELKAKGYTDQQIADIQKMAVTANDAATKVKTFTQLWDTLKEAAQSGWTQTWETIVGDFEESKEFLTGISDYLNNIIGSASDARNELLSKGLSSGWKQLLNEGIGNETDYIETIKEVAKEHGVAVDDMIEKSGSFEKSLKEGWMTTDILSESIAKYADKLTGMSDEELKAAGYTQEHVEQIKELQKGLADGSISLEEFANKMKMDSGRQNLIDSLWNLVDSIESIIKPIKEAFSDIFPDIKPDQIYAFTEALETFTSKLTLGKTASENLKRTFKGLFAICDIVAQAVTAVVKAIAPLFGHVVDLGGGILGVTGAIGDWLVKLSEAIRESDIFNTVMQAIAGVIDKVATAIKNVVIAIKDWATGVAGAIKNSDAFNAALKGIAGFAESAANAIKTFISAVKEKIVAPGLELLGGLLERIGERISHIVGIAGEMGTKISEAMAKSGASFENNPMIEKSKAFMETLKGIGEGIAEVFGSLMDSIIEKVGNADFSGLFDLINTGAFAGIAVAIAKFLKTISNPIEEFGDIFAGIKDIGKHVIGILDSVKGCFEAYQQSLKADILQKIAIAIGILAASIVAISLIDSEKLTASLGAISMLFIDLMTAMSVFGKVSTDIAAVGKTIAAMIAISTSVLILASALKKLSELEFGEMMTGLVGVAGLTAIVVGFAKAMSKNGPVIMKGSFQLVIFAAAMKILASVCKDLSELSWEQLAGGLIGVGVLMGEVALFLNNTNFSGKAMSSAIGIVAIAGAMKILASACADFGQMKWEELGKGLAGISGLLLAIAGFTKLTGNAQNVISTSVALVIIAGAMKVFGSAVKDIGQMSWEELAKGLIAMAGGLTVVALATKLMPKNILSIGASLIIISGALVVLSEALTRMSIMTWEEIGKGLVALAGSMTILAVALRAMSTTLPGSAALLVATAALAVLAPVLTTLGGMSWESIAKGLIAIAGAFVIIGAAGAILGPLAPAILALSGALVAMGVGLLAISASLMVAGMGLSALAAGFVALMGIGAAGAAAIVSSMQIIIAGVAGLIPMVAKQFGLGIIAICQVISEGAPAIGEAIKAVVLSTVDVLVECVPAIAEGALQLVMGVLAALVEYTPQIVDYIFQFLIGVLESLAKNIPDLIQATVNVFASYFQGVIDALKSIDTQTLVNGIAAIGLISAFMVALAAIAVLTPAAMLGVLGMGAVIAELSLVLASIGAIAQIPGLQWLIDEGGQFLQSVGTAIGSFIGGIAGGFMSGVSSQFPQIGSDLSAFMTNVQPFLDGARNIDESVSTGVKALADAILVLTAANILEGLTSWLTGGSSLSDFGKELAEFGPYFKSYADSIAGIDGETVVASANAALALAEMASKLPNSGGVVGWFAGENSLSAFAQELQEFGPKLKAYADSVTGLDAGVVTNSTNAALAIAEMANKLPNQGGVAGWFAGENSLSVFAAELAEFGPKLKQYADSLVGLDPSIVTNSANAAMVLAEMANKLPNQGGAVSWFTGDNTLSVFGEELAKFGPYLKQFADSLVGLDPNVVVNAANAAKTLAEMAAALPNSGGVASWFAGDNTLSAFGTQLADFGPKLKTFADSVVGIDSASLSGVIDQTNKLVAMIKGMSGLDSSGATAFATALGNLGKAGVDAFVNAFKNSYAKVNAAITGMLSALIKGINAKKSNISSAFTKLIQDALGKIKTNQKAFDVAGHQLMVAFITGVKSSNAPIIAVINKVLTEMLAAIKRKYNEFTQTGAELMTKISEGIKSKINGINHAFIIVLDKALTAIRSQYNNFYNAGGYLVQGFANGITANTYMAAAKAAAMAKAASDAANAELKIKSPSRVGYQTGKYYDEGVAWGIDDNAYQAADASIKMAKGVIDSTEEEFDEDIFEKEIGAMIGDGIAKGILKSSDKATNAVKKTAKSTKKAYEESVKWIEDHKEANDLSLIEELAAWKRVQSRYTAGTEERKKADEEIARTQKELADANEEYYNSVLEVQEETNEKRKQLDEDYYAKTKEINDKLNQDIQALEDEYESALNSRSESLYNSYNLFDKVDPAEYVGGKTLIDNLQSQISAIDEWTTNINQLSSRISESGLVKELRDLGVSSAAQIKALNNMTEAELDEYVALWKEKHRLATAQARVELQDMDESISREIYELKDQADVELESYKGVWSENIQALNDESQTKLEELKTAWMQKVVGLTVDTESEFSKMATNITNILGNASGWSSAGANIIEGVLTGIVDNSASLYTEVENVMSSALNTAKEVLDINSPSGEFEEVGMYSDEGLAGGLRKFAYRVADSAENVGKTALKSLRNSIAKIADAVENGIDAQPTIRPVLDLSNVESGAAKLNAMFSRSQAMSISTGMNRGIKDELQNENIEPKAGNTYQFTQNNYSPKALSRVEIYRQTKNQFSAFERMVKA